MTDLTPREWAELLWLAGQGALGDAAPRASAPRLDPPAPPPTSPRADAVSVAVPTPSGLGDDDAPAPLPQVDARPPRPATPRPQRPRLIERALHRLAVRQPLGPPEVDVAASVAHSARLGRHALVLRRAAVPAGRLVVLEDHAAAMAPFAPQVRDLVRAAQRGRRFHRVVHLGLDLRDATRVVADHTGGDAARRADHRPLGDDAAPPDRPKAPRLGGPRTLTLLVTDGLTRGDLPAWLSQAGLTGPWAWLHPWAPAHWHRTGTTDLRSAAVPPRGHGLPLLPFTGPALERLTPWVHGRGPGRLRGLVLPRHPARRPAPADPALTALTFADHADPGATRALGLAAAVPGEVDADLLRFLGEALTTGPVAPHHLAEAAACPLVTARRDGDRCVFTFPDAARRRAALRWLPTVDLPRILASLVRFATAHAEHAAALALPPVTLLVALTDPNAPVPDLPRTAVAAGPLRAWLEATEWKVSQALRDWLSPGKVPALPRESTAHPSPPWDGPNAHLVPPLITIVPGTEFQGQPGTFWMGSPDGVGHDDERPQRLVTLTRAYALGEAPVTQAQWRAVVEAAKAAPWGRAEAGVADLNPAPSRFSNGPDAALRPVEGVSWHDAVVWCNALSRLTGRTPAYRRDDDTWVRDPDSKGFRLPTEAEWEHACRAGTTTRWSFGDDVQRLREHAWFGERYSTGSTHPVKTKLPNRWGLHDVHGNVWEWCEDGWSPTYDANATLDPAVPPRGVRRVFRGGSFWLTADGCRSAYRNLRHPVSRFQDLGLRVALSPPPSGTGL